MHAFCFLCCKNSIQKMNECISFTVTWDLIGLQLRDSLKVIRHGECKCFAVYLRCVLLYYRFIVQSQLWPFFEQHTLFLVLVQVFLSLALVFLSLVQAFSLLSLCGSMLFLFHAKSAQRGPLLYRMVMQMKANSHLGNT